MLLWHHRHGKHLKAYEEQERNGRKTPLRDQPTVFSGNEWLWEAYMACDTCRSIGMVAGPIPWTAVDAYARRLRFDPDGFELLWCIIHRADTAYRAETAKEQG